MAESARVLIIDGDGLLAHILKNKLEETGAHVNTCLRASECLAAIQRTRPQIIIMELVLPDSSGFDLLKQVKSTPASKDSQIIILSILDQPEYIKEAMGLGASVYLRKTEVNVNDLLLAVGAARSRMNG